jgi:hypothetical protein
MKWISHERQEVIFYNVFAMSQALHELAAEGETVDDVALAALCSDLTAHVNQLGRYDLVLMRRPPALDYTLFARLYSLTPCATLPKFRPSRP